MTVVIYSPIQKKYAKSARFGTVKKNASIKLCSIELQPFCRVKKYISPFLAFFIKQRRKYLDRCVGGQFSTKFNTTLILFSFDRTILFVRKKENESGIILIFDTLIFSLNRTILFENSSWVKRVHGRFQFLNVSFTTRVQVYRLPFWLELFF